MSTGTQGLWIAFRFCIFVLWTQCNDKSLLLRQVVNCFQILYIRSLNTMLGFEPIEGGELWIAFRFCIFVLWTQWSYLPTQVAVRCELLSDFVYSFFEHNCPTAWITGSGSCELLSDFVYSFFEHNRICVERLGIATYGRCSRTKKSGICRIFLVWRAGFQNNSNWMPSSGRFSDFCELKSSIAANCLSVIRRIPTFPLGGRKDFALFMWTSAFSALAQWRR